MLPAGSTLNSSIKSPEEHLGWKIGTRHVRHHEVVSYARLLCEQSDRMTWHAYGETWGGRPLGIVIFSRSDRQSELDTIAIQRRTWAYGVGKHESDGNESQSSNIKTPPSAAWLGYSVHGDEASAVNASMLLLYALAAMEGPWIDAVLEQHILLIDPSLNPDGIDRFANWANDHRGAHPSAEDSDIEHQQGWPRGRTNHYNFDLNRDWLPATQPESQGRLEIYHQWIPNLVLDFHEMGTEQSLFFQPGVEGRDHPLSPALVRDVTQGFARRYAETMDQQGQRYFTQEKYDDFYPGKGSTYPDVHGSVGILVEQGSTRGLVHTYGGKTRTFEASILNPFRLSLATLASLQEYHRPLLEYQRDFYGRGRQGWLKNHPDGYAFEIPNDPRIRKEFLRLLERHRIEIYQLKSALDLDDESLSTDRWWVAPSDQLQGLFLHAIMDRTKSFEFDKFYDVSAWNMADAFGVLWRSVETDVLKESLGLKVSEKTTARPAVSLDAHAVAIVIPGMHVNVMTLVQRLQVKGIVLRTALLESTVQLVDGTQRTIPVGSVLLHRADSIGSWANDIAICEAATNELELDALSIRSSLTERGPDLGSESFPRIATPKIAMLVGEGTDVTESGSLWFTLDRLLQLPTSRLEPSQLTPENLTRFNCLFIPDGDRSRLNSTSLSAIREWVRRGGQLVLLSAAVANLSGVLASDENFEESKVILASSDGVILEAEVSGSSWLAKSLRGSSIKIFQSEALWPISDGAILKLSKEPLVAGFVPEVGQRKIAEKTVMGLSKIGRGQVVSMTFNPTFRGHYWGTIGLLKNVIFHPAE